MKPTREQNNITGQSKARSTAELQAGGSSASYLQ